MHTSINNATIFPSNIRKAHTTVHFFIQFNQITNKFSVAYKKLKEIDQLQKKNSEK